MPFFGVPIRNGLPIGLGSSAGFGVQPFDPSYLFSAGEQGFFYDPSDFSTLFQDSAGTTPVTGVEQVVGLMLDKSKGLVLGAEQVVNGNPFVAGSWTLNNPSVAVVGGKLVFTNAPSATDLAYQSGYGVVNRVYEITIVISSMTTTLGGGVSFGFSDGSTFTTQGPFITSAGTYTYRLNAQVTRVTFRGRGGVGATFSAVVENVSIKQVLGNHATSTGAARPTLSARVNLLTKTEQFDDGVWGKTNTTVAANTEIAPNGTLTADTLSTTAATAIFAIGQNFTVPANVSLIHAKAGTANFLQVSFNGDTTSFANFDLLNGVVGASGGTATATIFPDKNGWYRCSVSNSASTVTGVTWGIAPSASATRRQIFTGTGAENIYIWGADLRVANDGVGIPAYQRVNTATDYDSSGFPLYLRFGGTQAMSTGSIDFTATDKMSVFAGVRKLSDGTFYIVAETSSNSTLNAGAFGLFDPRGSISPDRTYSFRSENDIAVSSPEVLAPTTYVSASQANRAAPSIVIQRNGVQVGSTTASQGVGNYGNYPLYIGARNLASLFLNGRIYSLIGVGSAVSAGNIAAMESWVNGRTNAY